MVSTVRIGEPSKHLAGGLVARAIRCPILRCDRGLEEVGRHLVTILLAKNRLRLDNGRLPGGIAKKGLHRPCLCVIILFNHLHEARHSRALSHRVIDDEIGAGVGLFAFNSELGVHQELSGSRRTGPGRSYPLGAVVSITKKDQAKGSRFRRDEPDLGQRLARVLVVAAQHLFAVSGIDGGTALARPRISPSHTSWIERMW